MNKFLSVTLLLLSLTTACKALEGVEYINMKIQGKEYSVPIPNKETRDDYYYVRKALAGDELAREFLLGGKDQKLIYIGDINAVRWLKITKTTEEVIEYKGEK